MPTTIDTLATLIKEQTRNDIKKEEEKKKKVDKESMQGHQTNSGQK